MEGSIKPPVILGPAPWFRVDDKFLRQGPDGKIVGSFRQYVWEVQSRQYARYHCTEPHTIRFEDPAKSEEIRLGRFSNTWVEDGILHPDYTLRARYLYESQTWHEFKNDTYWPVMVIEAAN
jgi:hypothetical protein